MGQQTGIEWTDFSSNPLKYRDRETGRTVWACVKHSTGCAHCYAETLAKRYGRGGPFTAAEMRKIEPYLCEKELHRLLTSKKLAGKRVFLGDMTDVFGEWVPSELLDQLFAVLALRPDVTFQVLTKRAGRMASYFNDPDENPVTGEDTKGERICAHLEWVQLALPDGYAAAVDRLPTQAPYLWPLPNVWFGVSVENQAAADERIPELLKVPAAVRFLSCEPLLGPVSLAAWLEKYRKAPPGIGGIPAGSIRLLGDVSRDLGYHDWPPCLDWVIVGGESGADARHFRVEWARSLAEQCKAAAVPLFVKQLGARVTTRLPDGERWAGGDGLSGHLEFSGDGFGNYHVAGLRDRKGGDPAEWPVELRVRQYPEVPHV